MAQEMKWDTVDVLKVIYELICVGLFSLIMGCGMGTLFMGPMVGLRYLFEKVSMGDGSIVEYMAISEGSIIGGGVALILGPILYYGVVRDYLNIKNLGLLVAACFVPSMLFGVIFNPMFSIAMPPSILGIGSLIIQLKETEKTASIQSRRKIFQYIDRHKNNVIKFFIEFICVLAFSLVLGLGMNNLFVIANAFHKRELIAKLIIVGLIVYPVLGLILYYGLVRKYLNLRYFGLFLSLSFFTSLTVVYIFHGVVAMILNPVLLIIGCIIIWIRESKKMEIKGEGKLIA